MAPYRKVKPMPNEKVQRNQELLTYHIENPKATLRETGSLFGLSQTRVWYLLRREKDKGQVSSLESNHNIQSAI